MWAGEVRVAAPLSADGNLHANVDSRDQGDGGVRTDVALAYDWAYSMGMDNITYEVEIREGGQTVVRYDDLEHHHHGTWHQEVWSDGAPDLNVVRDVPYLVQSGAVPGSATPIASSGAALAKALDKLANAHTGPMSPTLADPAMPNPDGPFDIGHGSPT